MKNLQRSLILLAAGLLVLAAIFTSVSAGRHMATSLTLQRSEVDRQIGRSIVAVIQKALTYGVPFERLVDTERYLESIKQDNAGMRYLIVADMKGGVLYSTNLADIKDRAELEWSIALWKTADVSAPVGRYTNIAFPISVQGRQVGSLHVGQPGSMVRELLWDIAYDVITVLIVASIVAFGLMRLLLTLSVSTPLRALQEFLAAISAGDFRHYLPRDFLGGIGEINQRINQVITGLNAKAEGLRASGRPAPEGYRFHARGERDTLMVSAVHYIQWPFFLLIFADSLSLSFFPIFVGQFYDASFNLRRKW
jgi:HAMP domain-containing protein